MAVARSTVWIDAAGMTQQSIYRTNTGAASIQTALVAVSNATVQRFWEGTEFLPGGGATAASYESVGDEAWLLFAGADSSTVTLRILAPKAAIFKADGQTVDPANAGVAAVIAAAAAHLETASGALAVTYLGGVRRRRNRDYP